MGSEILLYGYGAICFSMILFNLIYNMVLRGSEKKLIKVRGNFIASIDQQLEGVQRGERVELQHKKKLKHKLLRVSNMVALDKALETKAQADGDSEIYSYLRELQDMILELAQVYVKRDNLQSAFFAYFISRHTVWEEEYVKRLEELMMEYLKKNSFYCKINALQALCSFGRPESIINALELQDRDTIEIHEKIMTEILFSYKGDHEQLIGLLWQRFDVFSERMKLALLNYIRFRSGNWKQEMYRIMTDVRQDKELRLAAIRYFAKYPWEEVRKDLLAMVLSKDPQQWEAAAISATALASYDGEDVVQSLMSAMGSSNWYIRYNASASLEAHGLGYSQLLDIIRGSDRYAREMVLYRLEESALKKEEQHI